MTDSAKILIVDDEPFNVDYLEQELEDLGYRTMSASDGREALAMVADAPPDLILLDVMMPEMDGFTACQILKDNDETRLIPILIMTALDGIEDRIKGIEAGADDFLTKPVNERELAARIATALKLKGAMEEKLGELRTIKDHFANFVPETVRRRVADNPDAPELAKTERDVAVLFLDISGYSRLSERLAPERINALIERYFSAFMDLIADGGGDINETAGDGFMAIFEAPEPAMSAAAAALAILARTETLNAEALDLPLGIHMGLASGTALVGSTRFEGQRGSRWTFTASGPVVNLAARLAAVAVPGEVLVCPETARQVAGKTPLESIGTRTFKNITKEVDVHRLSRTTQGA
jgi:DNA-binding response OmpR family regulator